MTKELTIEERAQLQLALRSRLNSNERVLCNAEVKAINNVLEMLRTDSLVCAIDKEGK